jgi:hypothetical protein
VAGPSASNAGQRPVSRRQALAYDSSLASVTVVPPRGCDRHAFRTPTATLAQGVVAGDPTRLASIVGAGFSLAGPSGDASKKPSQPSGGKQ